MNKLYVVDFDTCLIDLASMICKQLRKDGVGLKREEIISHDLTDVLGTKYDESIRSAMLSTAVIVKDGAKNAVQTLIAQGDQVMTTFVRDGYHEHKTAELILNSHFPGVSIAVYDRLPKAPLVYVGGVIKNTIRFKRSYPTTRCYLMREPWNEWTLNVSNSFHIFDSWGDIMDDMQGATS